MVLDRLWFYGQMRFLGVFVRDYFSFNTAFTDQHLGQSVQSDYLRYTF